MSWKQKPVPSRSRRYQPFLEPLEARHLLSAVIVAAEHPIDLTALPADVGLGPIAMEHDHVGRLSSDNVGGRSDSRAASSVPLAPSSAASHVSSPWAIPAVDILGMAPHSLLTVVTLDPRYDPPRAELPSGRGSLLSLQIVNRDRRTLGEPRDLAFDTALYLMSAALWPNASTSRSVNLRPVVAEAVTYTASTPAQQLSRNETRTTTVRSASTIALVREQTSSLARHDRLLDAASTVVGTAVQPDVPERVGAVNRGTASTVASMLIVSEHRSSFSSLAADRPSSKATFPARSSGIVDPLPTLSQQVGIAEGGFVDLGLSLAEPPLDAAFDSVFAEPMLGGEQPSMSEVGAEAAETATAERSDTVATVETEGHAATKRVAGFVAEDQPLVSYDVAEGGMVEIPWVTELCQTAAVNGAAATDHTAGPAHLARRLALGRLVPVAPVPVNAGLGLFHALEIAGDPDQTGPIARAPASRATDAATAEADPDLDVSESELQDWLSLVRSSSFVSYAAFALPVIAIVGSAFAARLNRRRRQGQSSQGLVDPTICDVLFGQLPCLQLESLVGCRARLTGKYAIVR